MKWGGAMRSDETKPADIIAEEPQTENNLIVGIENKNGKSVFRVSKPRTNMALEGGGGKGLAFPGAIEEMETKNYIEKEEGKKVKIKRVAGSSAGAITAALIALGLKGQALRDQVDSVDASVLLDRGILRGSGPLHAARMLLHMIGSNIIGATKKRNKLSSENYTHTGNNLLQAARDIIFNRVNSLYEKATPEQKIEMDNLGIKHHMDINRITFMDLKHLSRIFPDDGIKDLIITGTELVGNLEEIRKQTYFNYIDTPDMEIALAMRISASLPQIFRSLEYNGNYYMDGGMSGNCPVNAFMNPLFNDDVNPSLEDDYSSVVALQFKKGPKEKVKKEGDWEINHHVIKLVRGQVSIPEWVMHEEQARQIVELAKNNGLLLADVDYGKLDTMEFNATKEMIEEARKLSAEEIRKNINAAIKYMQLDKMKDAELVEHIENILSNNFSIDVTNENEDLRKPKNINETNEYRNNMLITLSEAAKLRIKTNPALFNPDLFKRINEDTELNKYVSDKEIKKQKLSGIRDTEGLHEYIRECDKPDSPERIDFIENLKLTMLKTLASTVKGVNVSTEDREKVIQFFSAVLKMENLSVSDVILMNSGAFQLKNILHTNGYINTNQLRLIENVLISASENVRRKFDYVSVEQVRNDVMNFNKNERFKKHEQILKLYSNPEPLTILSSPLIIQDILKMYRMEDLKLINYGRPNSKRAGYIREFIQQIENGDPHWLHDLMHCVRIFQEAKQDGKSLEDEEYRNRIRIQVIDATKSPVAKIFLNTKLKTQDQKPNNFYGNTLEALSDLSNEVERYLIDLSYHMQDPDLAKKIMPNRDRIMSINRIEVKDKFENPLNKIPYIASNINPAQEISADKITKREQYYEKLNAFIQANPLSWYESLTNGTIPNPDNAFLSIIYNSKTKENMPELVNVIDKMLSHTKTEEAQLDRVIKNELQVDSGIAKKIRELNHIIRDLDTEYKLNKYENISSHFKTTSHQSSINALIATITTIMNSNSKPEQKYIDMIRALEDTFLKEMKNSKLGFFNIDFVDKLKNTKKNEYVFPKLLAKHLSNLFKNDELLKQLNDQFNSRFSNHQKCKQCIERLHPEIGQPAQKITVQKQH